MKKIIEKSFMCLLISFFILFVLLIRKDAENHLILYSIALIIVGSLSVILPILLNNCKKINAKRWYIISLSSYGLTVIIHAIYLLFIHNGLDNAQTLSNVNKVFLWLQRIPLAISITSTLLLLFYTVKDFFNKEYKLQKFDLYAFKMFLNVLTYLFIFFIVIDKGGFVLHEHLNPIDFSISFYTLEFVNYDNVLLSSLIVLLVYIILYVVIELVNKYIFENDKTSSNIYK